MAGRQAILRIDRIQPLCLQPLELHLIFVALVWSASLGDLLHVRCTLRYSLELQQAVFFRPIVIMAVVQPPPLSALADAPLSPLGVDSKPATTGRELWKSAPCVVLITRRPGCSKCLALLLCFVSTTFHLQLASTY